PFDSGENHHVHWEASRPQVGVDEMNGEDEEDGEQSFFAVDDEHRVERPPREEMRKERRKPHGITGETDDDHAPEDRPVVELLPIGIAFEGGLGAETKEPAEVG